MFDNIEVPEGGFGCILADPPWKFNSYAPPTANHDRTRRDVEKHYETMKLDDIRRMPVRDLMAKDAHCFLWVTSPCLPQGLEVLKDWGFKYSSMGFVWVKQRRGIDVRQVRLLPTSEGDLHLGLGFTTRKNAEFVLLGRRGKAKRMARDVFEIILSPVREHSRKPDDVYDRVQRYCGGPYLELFARQSRPGWTTWGNEATKFDKVSS